MVQPCVAECQLQRDVPAEGHDVPRFEPGNQPRLDELILFEKVIQPGRKCIAESACVRVEPSIFVACMPRDLERPIDEIAF